MDGTEELEGQRLNRTKKMKETKELEGQRLKRHKRKHKTKVKQENRTRYCFNKNCKNILKEKCLEMEHNLLPCLDCEFPRQVFQDNFEKP